MDSPPSHSSPTVSSPHVNPANATGMAAVNIASGDETGPEMGGDVGRIQIIHRMISRAGAQRSRRGDQPFFTFRLIAARFLGFSTSSQTNTIPQESNMCHCTLFKHPHMRVRLGIVGFLKLGRSASLFTLCVTFTHTIPFHHRPQTMLDQQQNGSHCDMYLSNHLSTK